MAQMNVSFGEEILDVLKRLVPARKRSAFIEKAVIEKLDQLRQERALAASAGAWEDEGRADPSDEVRLLREGWKRLRGKSQTPERRPR